VHPDTDDPTRIEIAFEVKTGTPLNRQSTAKVATVSLMASPALLITTGSNAAPRLAPGDVVPSEEGVNPSDLTRRMAIAVDNANTVLLDLHREIPEIAAQVHSVLDNINALTGAENQQQVRAVLAGVRTLVNDTDAVIVSAKPLMANIDQTVSNVSRTFDSVRGTVDAAREPLIDDLKALHDTLEDARRAIGSVQGVVQTNADDFAETMRALRTTAENLRALSEQLKERPWNLIRTTQADDRKVPR
jgi:ABC-type transporter Mla subunit MlaD